MRIRQVGKRLHLIRTEYSRSIKRGKDTLLGTLDFYNPVVTEVMTAGLSEAERAQLSAYLSKLLADRDAKDHALAGAYLSHSLRTAGAALAAGWRPQNLAVWEREASREFSKVKRAIAKAMKAGK